MADEFRLIPLVDLIDPPFVLREVDQCSVEYTELKDSLTRCGFLNSICVRSSTRQPGKFEVVDGRWRTTAARETPITEIPCIVKHELTDKDVLAMQVIANATRYKTMPSSFARQLRRLLASKTGMTQAELCQILNKNPHWVRKMLGMAKLTRYSRYRNTVDRGEMSLEAAYYLSRLPGVQWAEYAVDAKVLPLREFKALVMSLLRQRRAQIQLGVLKVDEALIEPRPYARTVTDLVDELENARSGPLILTMLNCETPLEGWRSALKWAVHLDCESLKRRRLRLQKRLQKRTIKR